MSSGRPHTLAGMGARLDRVEALLARATEFTFDVDLSEVDASGTEVNLESIARIHALVVTRNQMNAWGLRYGQRPYFWDPHHREWFSGFRGLGSRDTALFIADKVSADHRRKVEDLARRLVHDYRVRHADSPP